jgi:hypothetical protein
MEILHMRMRAFKNDADEETQEVDTTVLEEVSCGGGAKSK